MRADVAIVKNQAGKDRDMSPQMAPEPELATVVHSPRPDQDCGLLEALRGREPTAADCLVSAYGERSYRLAARITRNEQDAEEVVQDAFYAVIQKIDTFRGESAFGSWLYRIVANAAYKKLRIRRRRRDEVCRDEVLSSFDEHSRHVPRIADWSARVNDPSIQTELRMALEAAIDELPPAYRMVLVLRDVEGHSNPEIAELLNLSLTAVKIRVHRARLFVRKQLGSAMTALDRITAAEVES